MLKPRVGYAFLLALWAYSVCLAAPPETAKVKTPRGVELNVAIHAPAKPSGKVAAVVIAPGQGYHMDLPIVRELAERLAENGVMAFRFDWNYFSTDPQKGSPSPGLTAELEDMQTVINFARRDSRVNPDQVIIAGKSIGSVVAYRAFTNDASAKALVLLTPLCSRATDDNGRALPAPLPTAPQNYPRFGEVSKPVVMVVGNADPLCSPPLLFDFIKGTKGNVAAVVIGGDHGWNIGGVSDAAFERRNAENIAAGVQLTAHWVNVILQR
jgi:dienelactone hydrolase